MKKSETPEQPAPETPANPETQEQALAPEAEKPEGVPIDEPLFPDSVFRACIEKRFNDKSNPKGILIQAEISKVTTLSLSVMSVSNTQGLEYFTELQDLSISSSDFSSFTLKEMNKLTKLKIRYNKKLTFLNLDLPNLEYLDCSYNHLTAIDVNNFKKLSEIWYNNNPTKWTFYTEITAADDCTITFNTMGRNIVEDQIIANGKQATELAAPTKEGYIFKDRYLDKEFSKPYDFTTPVKEDIILYAN